MEEDKFKLPGFPLREYETVLSLAQRWDVDYRDLLPYITRGVLTPWINIPQLDSLTSEQFKQLENIEISDIHLIEGWYRIEESDVERAFSNTLTLDHLLKKVLHNNSEYHLVEFTKLNPTTNRNYIESEHKFSYKDIAIQRIDIEEFEKLGYSNEKQFIQNELKVKQSNKNQSNNIRTPNDSLIDALGILSLIISNKVSGLRRNDKPNAKQIMEKVRNEAELLGLTEIQLSNLNKDITIAVHQLLNKM